MSKAVMKQMNENEYVLYHYGVLGMKWGVRRDARILANHRYNKNARRLETARTYGMIDYDTYSKGMKSIKARKKQELNDVKTKFKNAKTDEEREKIGKDISKTAVSEVPDIKVQRGLTVANQLIGTAGLAKTAVTTASLSLINPAFAGAYLGAGVVTAAAQTGLNWASRKYLDTKA